MLTIKRHSEKRTLYLYSSAAVIVGFAGIMTFLVQSNANLSEFVSVAPTQSEPNKVSPVTKESNQAKTEEETTPASTDNGTSQNWTLPVVGSNNTTPVTPAQPAAEQLAPVTTTPTTPVVSEAPVTKEPESPATTTPAISVPGVIEVKLGE